MNAITRRMFHGIASAAAVAPFVAGCCDSETIKSRALTALDRLWRSHDDFNIVVTNWFAMGIRWSTWPIGPGVPEMAREFRFPAETETGIHEWMILDYPNLSYRQSVLAHMKKELVELLDRDIRPLSEHAVGVFTRSMAGQIEAVVHT